MVCMAANRISAITICVKDMSCSFKFYSRIPGFSLAHGGPAESFTSFEVGKGSNIYLNLELANETSAQNFGRIIFHVDSVDEMHEHLRNDPFLSSNALIESRPQDAPWGERYFHVRDPDGYQLSFAKPI